MTSVRKSASVAPRTVTEVSMGKHSKKTRKAPTKKTRKSPVVKVQVDKRVWKEALRLAGGDALRLQVVSKNEVIVKNKSKGDK